MSIHSSGRILPGFLCKWFPTSCVHYLCGICLARIFEAIYRLCHLCIRITYTNSELPSLCAKSTLEGKTN